MPKYKVGQEVYMLERDTGIIREGIIRKRRWSIFWEYLIEYEQGIPLLGMTVKGKWKFHDDLYIVSE